MKIKMGDTLKNGSIVIAIDKGIVLAMMPYKSEYVTWSINSDGETYFGHYFASLKNATNDFYSRVDDQSEVEKTKMRLIYTDTEETVKVGDVVELREGQAEVIYFVKPHKPNSSGKVTVEYTDDGRTCEYYVGVIGAKWINRDDQ